MRITATMVQEAFEELAKKKGWSTPKGRLCTKETYVLHDVAAVGRRWVIQRHTKGVGGYDDSEMPVHRALTSWEMYLYLCGRIREA